MANWNRKKVDPSLINGGKEFTADDNLAVNELNAMVNNSFYGVDFVEAMADAPDISEIAGDGTPSVSLVPNGEFMKFKFSNLKGERGEQGVQGEKGDKGETGDTVPNTLTIGSVVSGDTASATITGIAPNQVLDLVLPKGEKGEKGEDGQSGECSFSYELIGQLTGNGLSSSKLYKGLVFQYQQGTELAKHGQATMFLLPPTNTVYFTYKTPFFCFYKNYDSSIISEYLVQVDISKSSSSLSLKRTINTVKYNLSTNQIYYEESPTTVSLYVYGIL